MGVRDPDVEPKWTPSTDFDAPEALAALRQRDEEAFTALFERFYDNMVRLALTYVRNLESAKEVVQESWIGIARGIERFEARSTLKTWMFRIVVNRARTHAKRDGKAASVEAAFVPSDEPELTDDWFVPPPDARAGKWAVSIRSWERDPEALVLDRELSIELARAIDSLPPSQQVMLTLRDVEGLSTSEVSELLDVSPGNQRVLLHRARTKMREVLSDYVAREVSSS